jgi:hypothetical protein
MMDFGFIPQVFYDLIARVIPGTVVIIVWYLTILGPNKAAETITEAASNKNIFNFWALALMFMLSYVLGFILQETWASTFKKKREKTDDDKEDREKTDDDKEDREKTDDDKEDREKTDDDKEDREKTDDDKEDREKADDDKKDPKLTSIDRYNKVRKCFGEPELEFGSKDLPDSHIMIDQIRPHSASEAYRLLKLRAETRLCEGLFVGLFLLPVINILFWYYDDELLMLDRAILELVVIIAIITLWRARNRHEELYRDRTSASWLSISFPVGPRKQAEEDKN